MVFVIMSFSIVTVTLNSEETLEETILSVRSQEGVFVQHIIKDGFSGDRTAEIADNYRHSVEFYQSSDVGIYDAMNQGVSYATGSYICFLNSDDIFSTTHSLREVQDLFERSGADIVYGDIEIIDSENKVLRQWRAGSFKQGKLKWKQLPHPAFFIRRSAIENDKFLFDTSYKISADLKQQLYLINIMKLSTAYLPKVITIMRHGGRSSNSLRSFIEGWSRVAIHRHTHPPLQRIAWIRSCEYQAVSVTVR